MNIDKNLVQQLRLVPKRFFLSLFAGLMSGLVILVQALALSLIISEVFISHKSLGAIKLLLSGFVVIILFRTIVTFVQNINAKLLANQVKTHLRKALFSHLLKLGPNFTENFQSGDLATITMQGIENLEGYFSQYLPQLFLSAVIPALILIVIFPLDLLTGLIFFITAPLIPIFMLLIGKSSETLTKRQWLTLRRLGAHFLDTIQALKTLKLMNQSKNYGKQVSNNSEKYRQVTLNVLRVTFLSALVLEMITTLSTAIIAVQIGLRLLYGGMGFQQALFILIIAPEFYLPLRTLGLRFHAGISGVNASNSIFAILNHSLPQSFIHHHSIPQTTETDPIRFSHVTYTYPDRAKPALVDLSFEIPAGKITALVGMSGAGKSTIFNLLLRFIEPQNGEIYIGDCALSSLDISAWRDCFAWVPQKPFLFHESIAANIHMGDHDPENSRVTQASIDANLHDFIQELPDGYNTIIGEHGQRLSGGQAQRLAIARAFYKNAPMLLLDEPISRLDPENQQLIQESINMLTETRTVFIIAHHLQSITRADSIFFLQDGRLIDCGTHQQLVTHNPQYRLFTAGLQGGN